MADNGLPDDTPDLRGWGRWLRELIEARPPELSFAVYARPRAWRMVADLVDPPAGAPDIAKAIEWIERAQARMLSLEPIQPEAAYRAWKLLNEARALLGDRNDHVGGVDAMIPEGKP